MQKKVIAVAVAAALAAPLAMADTAVTISGLIKMGLEQYDQKNRAGYSSETRVSDQSSRMIFNVKEDLGGGMNSFVQIDMRVAPDLGTLGATGNTYVGVGGGWGRVWLGRHDLHYTESAAIEGAVGLSAPLQAFSSLGPMNQVTGAAVQLAGGTRTPNVIAYESPDFNGFNGRLAYSTNYSVVAANEGSGVANGSKDGAWNLALRYAAGPLKAGYSYWAAKVEGTTDFNGVMGDERGDTLYGGYAFGPVKVGLAWNKSKTKLAANAPYTTRSAWMLPVSWQGGPHVVEAVYTRLGNRSGGVAGQVNNDTSANMWRLSYQYYLSKRTAVGVHYSHLDNKANAAYNFFSNAANGSTASVAGSDPRQLYFGVGHAF